jgi:hypothetical protein
MKKRKDSIIIDFNLFVHFKFQCTFFHFRTFFQLPTDSRTPTGVRAVALKVRNDRSPIDVRGNAHAHHTQHKNTQAETDVQASQFMFEQLHINQGWQNKRQQ